MSIAFYDADFMAGLEECYFNIHLMKLSSYYKQKKEIVILITDLSKTHLYSKIIYWQNREDLEFSPLLSKIQNIEFYGLAFTNGKRIQLDEEIERCIPDKTLYLRVIERMKMSKAAEARVKSNKNVFPVTFFQKNNKWELIEHMPRHLKAHVVMITEPDFREITNWEEIIQPFISDITSICFVFPQICNSREELLKLSKLRYTRWSNPIIIDYPINKKEIQYFAANLSKNFLARCVIPFGKKPLPIPELKSEIYNLLNYCIYMKTVGKPFNIQYYWNYTGLTANYFGKYLMKWNNDIRIKKSFSEYHARNKQAVLVMNLVKKSIPQIERPLNIDPYQVYEKGGIYLYDTLGNQEENR